MVKTTKVDSLLEDEWYHVRHSGEIPEIALHSSFYYLAEDTDGPRIKLDRKARLYLLEAAVARYREIILRDLTPENRELSVYRGVLRSIANWRRLKRFCQRHKLDHTGIGQEVGVKLLIFLEKEVAETENGKHSASLNCSFADLNSFALELDVSLAHLESRLSEICCTIS